MATLELYTIQDANTSTVCLYNTIMRISYRWQQWGVKRIESNQFAKDVSCLICFQRYKYELSATSNLGRRFLPASISIHILSLVLIHKYNGTNYEIMRI